MHTPLSYLANGWADHVQILWVNRDPFDKSFTHVWGGVHLHVRTCTPRFPDLANGWADRVQILCVNRDPFDKSFTHVWGGVHLHVRTCTPRFPDLANGWADCVQILCVNRDPLDNCFPHVWGGVHLHVRTCTPRFPDLANGWADCVQILCVNRDPLDNCFTHVWGGVHLHVRTCTPLGGTFKFWTAADLSVRPALPATRTTNLRSAALPQKRCLAGNRRLVEHGDNNYSLELLFSQWETNLSYRNRALNKQLCWRFRQVGTSLTGVRIAAKTSHNMLSREIYRMGSVATPWKIWFA